MPNYFLFVIWILLSFSFLQIDKEIDVSYEKVFFQNNGEVYLDSNLVLTFQKSGKVDSVFLKSLVRNDLKFVVLIPPINCISCTEDIFTSHNSELKRIGSERIIYIAGYENVREVMTFKRVNSIRDNIYRNELLQIPNTNFKDVLLLFTINKDYEASNFFLLTKDSKTNLNKYIKSFL